MAEIHTAWRTACVMHMYAQNVQAVLLYTGIFTVNASNPYLQFLGVIRLLSFLSPKDP
jgi:hypothetical protein